MVLVLVNVVWLQVVVMMIRFTQRHCCGCGVQRLGFDDTQLGASALQIDAFLFELKHGKCSYKYKIRFPR